MPAPPDSKAQAASKAARSANSVSNGLGGDRTDRAPSTPKSSPGTNSNDGAHRGRSPKSPAAVAKNQGAVRRGEVTKEKAKENENQARAQHNAKFPDKAADKKSLADLIKDQLKKAAARFGLDPNKTPDPAEIAAAIDKVAKNLGISPKDLAMAIGYETIGTFSPDIWGGLNNNHLGLIQFGGPEREKYGVKPGQTFTEQMNAVENFLRDRGVKPGMDLKDVYSTINAGSPGRYKASDRVGSTVTTHVEAMQKQFGGLADNLFSGLGAQPSTPSAVKTALTGLGGLLQDAIKGKPVNKENIKTAAKDAIIQSIPGGPLMEFAGRIAINEAQKQFAQSAPTTPKAVRSGLDVMGMLPGGLGIIGQGLAAGVAAVDPPNVTVKDRAQRIADRFGLKFKGGKPVDNSTAEKGGDDRRNFPQRQSMVQNSQLATNVSSAGVTTAALNRPGVVNAAYDPSKDWSWSNNPFLSINPDPDAGIIPKVTVDPTTPGPLSQLGFDFGLNVNTGVAVASVALIIFGIWSMAKGKTTIVMKGST